MKMNIYFVLVLFTFFGSSCSSIPRNEREESILNGNAKRLSWSTISGNYPEVEVEFVKEDGLFYKIESLEINDANLALTIDDRTLNQKTNELLFVDTDLSPVVWSLKGDMKKLELNGGDGANTFIIELLFKDNELEGYFLRRRINGENIRERLQ